MSESKQEERSSKRKLIISSLLLLFPLSLLTWVAVEMWTAARHDFDRSPPVVKSGSAQFYEVQKRRTYCYVQMYMDGTSYSLDVLRCEDVHTLPDGVTTIKLIPGSSTVVELDIRGERIFGVAEWRSETYAAFGGVFFIISILASLLLMMLYMLLAPFPRIAALLSFNRKKREALVRRQRRALRRKERSARNAAKMRAVDTEKPIEPL